MSTTPHHPLSVILTCRDIKKSLAFYKDKLGFALEAAWPDAQNPMWCNLMLDGQSIMLHPWMPATAVEQCGFGSPEEVALGKQMANDFEKNAAGVGIQVYFAVPDVDRFHASIKDRGVEPLTAPKTQFYGIRDFMIVDPDGYRMIPYTAVKMESCQSCGMPLTDAKPGQMYCQYCTDEKGGLRPYEAILEGTTTGYFMAMQKMPREKAEKAAREHLAKMPAWSMRG